VHDAVTVQYCSRNLLMVLHMISWLLCEQPEQHMCGGGTRTFHITKCIWTAYCSENTSFMFDDIIHVGVTVAAAVVHAIQRLHTTYTMHIHVHPSKQ
jgi:hypothetical protein